METVITIREPEIATFSQTIHRRRPFWAILAVWACALFNLSWMVSANATQEQVLKGHMPRAAARQKPVGRLDPSARLDLVMGLPLRHPEQLTNLLQQLYQPAHPNFRHYLTSEQFTATFGPTEKDYQSVMKFATAHGLRVTGTHPNRTLLDVNGAVADIEKAFHVRLRLFQHPHQARVFFAPDAEPSVELDTPLLALSGLDNYVVPHPNLRRITIPPHQNGHPLGGSGSSGAYTGKDFRAAYAPGVSLTGAGQSLGLFELDGYKLSNITTYESETGLPNVALTNVLIDGFAGGSSLADGSDEVCLDIEMALSMAPGLSSILVYEGPPPPTAADTVTYPVTTTHVNDVLNRMATDNKAAQLSCSWGFDINATTQQIFQQYAAQGQSFFLACGDSGAFFTAVTEPADDPYVTVVGGTMLTTTGPAGAWVSETTWNVKGTILSPGGATGGGISLTYPIPLWQEGINMTANQGSTTMRNIPDVAMVADNIQFVYEGVALPVSGTSAAAPLWAGFAALVNQQGAAAGQAPIGFANPALYAIGQSVNYTNCFHDVTTGNNTSTNSPNKFFAVAGYDLCTGWGAPTGSNLIQALLTPPAEILWITSPLGFTASGPGGGAFNVASQTFGLTNLGSSPLNWSLVNTSAWLTVSSITGTLNPAGPAANVTVALNSTASNFLIGSYSASLWISNLTDGSAQVRQFNLLVGNGGFETGDFTDWTFSGSTNDNFVISADDKVIDGDAVFSGVNDLQFVHSGLYGAFLGQVGSMASITQTLPTMAGRLYLLSFWLTSIANTGTTPSGLVVGWNGATLLNQTNLGAFGWTNLQFLVPAAAASTTLQFSARDDTGGLGLDDVTLQTVPAPSIQSVTQSAGAINLTWNSLPGLVYQVQTAGGLSPAGWSNWGSTITATNTTVQASDNLASATQRFYRLVLLP
jgi:subtilase family serine protease